ncbi:S8 family serine peptidase [Psychroserpens luteus]|uniref:S8 family serine peptidase n=1 Tax=Psychroserpens luteus TaxID=1434066 RepID=A0ABW5ZSA2_9FLAO|nr:S8 family serine peptidase [Psychroserpens luteus]
MKIIVCLLIFFTTHFFYGQDFKEFYIEVVDNSYIPEYDKTKNKFLVNEKLKYSKSINTILDELIVSNCVYVNEIDVNLTENLLRVIIELQDESRVDVLVAKLINDFNQYISYEKLIAYESLYMPDDFETLDVSSQTNVTSNEQNDLIMIRAQEAWDITLGKDYVLIGVSDTGFQVDHPELTTEIVGGVGSYDSGTSSSSGHGSGTMGRVTAATDNNEGISSIGFDTKGLANRSLSINGMKELSLIGAKAVNGSFGSPSTTGGSISQQNIVNNMVANGTVVICAAGNGPYKGGTTGTNGVYTNESYASRYIYPASYQNVISVSTVGNKNDIGVDTDGDPLTYDNWKDVHLIKQPFPYHYSGTNPQIPISEANISFQHNDSVDIVVPTYYGTPALNPSTNSNSQYKNPGLGGTSWAAPVVAGTVGLMYSVNFCLDPKEIETIIKLTAVKIDDIPENLPFYGRLGAGRLDAYEAVKMSKDMADDLGTVEVKDRILYRHWFYKLVTAPYEIKMSNNDVTGGSKLKFKARNNIEILSGDYYPQTGGYIDLSIDETLTLDCTIPSSSSSRLSSIGKDESKESEIQVIPTLVTNNVELSNLPASNKNLISIKIYDFYKQEVYFKDKINSSSVNLNLEHLYEGIYILQILDGNGKQIHVQKIVKK